MRARYTMNETFKDILERMKERLPDGASVIEGTFTGNNLLAVADELARIYSQDIDILLPRAFAATAEGTDLDTVGKDIGVVRKSATCAEAVVTVSGEPGSYTDILVAADHLLFRLDDFVINSGRLTQVRAVCETVGTAGNVPAGAIHTVRTAGVLIDSVINSEAASGGYEAETDSDFRARILDKKRNPVTGGSREDYRQWALSVPGVGRAKVIDLFRGPGTVGIYIVAAGNTAAGAGLLKNVFAYIETVRPCGAGVEVLSAEPLQIDIHAAVVLTEGAHLSDTVDRSRQLLCEYTGGFPFLLNKKAILSYLKIAELLLQTEGIEDVTDLTVNGLPGSIMLEEIQFPVIGTITLKEAGA